LRDDASGVAANEGKSPARHDGQAQYANRKGYVASAARRRAPLTSWEEYAQALLQANETSFVN